MYRAWCCASTRGFHSRCGWLEVHDTDFDGPDAFPEVVPGVHTLRADLTGPHNLGTQIRVRKLASRHVPGVGCLNLVWAGLARFIAQP
jgi:hypothetical protein